MSVGLDEWYKEVWERTIRIEQKLDTLLGERGLEAAHYTTEDEAEEYEAPEVLEEPVHEPRYYVTVRDTATEEEEQLPFTSLPDDVQRGVSMAKSMGQLYQVYRDEGGSIRLVTTQEVVDRLARG